MTISDGYGDGDLFFEAAIRERERLLQIQVSERAWSDLTIRDDLLNEARITVWEVLAKRPDAPPAYVNASTGRRITEVATRGVWFGMEGHRGKAIDPLRRKDRDSFDDPDFSGDAAEESLEKVLLAYHEGEILEAIRSLPENHQRYVVLRFWGGWTPGELAPVIGVKSTNQARMWTESIRPVLAEALAHLRGAA